MTTITIGRQGNQPFKINQDGVSNVHAEIEIDNDGKWWLKDLGSKNGTFIREDNGELEQLGNGQRIHISEMTFVCLGPYNSTGCNFFAKQVLTPGNFKEEFEYLNDKNDELKSRLDEIDKIAWRMNLLKYILPPLLIALSFLIWKDTTARDYWIMRMSCSAIPSALIHIMYNPKRKKKMLEEEQKIFFVCPNPQCSHILKSFEIEDFKCNRCKNIVKQ